MRSLQLSKNWTTHYPMLIRLAMLTDKPILELGSGLFSTPLLHWICAEDGKELITYEKYDKYFKFARQFMSKNHRVRKVDDWAKVDFDDVKERHWGVVLVDHDDDRRIPDTIRLKDKADYIIIHDTDYSHEGHKLKELWENFEYVYHWKFCKPYTSVVSNFEDVSFLGR